jgi:hypothetical protein
MSDDKIDNVERLVKRMGFDPASRPSASEDLLKEVLGELNKERQDKAKVALKVTLEEAVKLREEMNKVDKQYNQTRANFNKQLGKLLNSLENSLRGRQQQPEGEAFEGESTPQE